MLKTSNEVDSDKLQVLKCTSPTLFSITYTIPNEQVFYKFAAVDEVCAAEVYF